MYTSIFTSPMILSSAYKIVPTTTGIVRREREREYIAYITSGDKGWTLKVDGAYVVPSLVAIKRKREKGILLSCFDQLGTYRYAIKPTVRQRQASSQKHTGDSVTGPGTNPTP